MMNNKTNQNDGNKFRQKSGVILAKKAFEMREFASLSNEQRASIGLFMLAYEPERLSAIFPSCTLPELPETSVLISSPEYQYLHETIYYTKLAKLYVLYESSSEPREFETYVHEEFASHHETKKYIMENSCEDLLDELKRSTNTMSFR